MSRPPVREDFDIAIICTLRFAYDAMSLLFDELWQRDDGQYKPTVGKLQKYVIGRIATYSVVLVLLSHKSKASGASLAASLRASYSGLRMCLFIGIYDELPEDETDDTGEIWVGDLFISKTVAGDLHSSNTIHSFLATLDADLLDIGQLKRQTGFFLKQLQAKAPPMKHQLKYHHPLDGQFGINYPEPAIHMGGTEPNPAPYRD